MPQGRKSLVYKGPPEPETPQEAPAPQEAPEQPEKPAAAQNTTPSPQAPSAQPQTAQRGVTAAFLVIAVLIAAKHVGTDANGNPTGISKFIAWIQKPAQKAS